MVLRRVVGRGGGPPKRDWGEVVLQSVIGGEAVLQRVIGGEVVLQSVIGGEVVLQSVIGGEVALQSVIGGGGGGPPKRDRGGRWSSKA